MSHSIKAICGAVALALAMTAGTALAQAPIKHKAFCVTVGTSPQEPVGDRAGHALQVSNYSCRTEGGPMEGGVMTGTNIFEWDGGKAVILSGGGVVRKPGSMLSYRVTEGSITLIMTDGKVSGLTGSGKGIVNLASGVVAALNGKTYSYTVQPLAPGQFALETIYD